MPRRKITFENGEFYHIYNRGVDKRNIVKNKNDIMRMLESLEVFNTTELIGSIYEDTRRKRNNQFGSRASKLVDILAFNILDNHYHLVLKQLSDGGISKFMHSFGTGYAKHFNEKYDRVGSLFQGVFKAEHINSDKYLSYVVSYVNINHFIHSYESFGSSISEWGMRSSLEQYVDHRREHKNKYFECDIDIIKSRFKNGKEYLKEAIEISKNIKERRKDKNLEAGLPNDSF
ncbi:MAG: transposase [Candidatus Pacebacteria bacterium]|nr:transposase [Candidatus Paceibacterota bacterium]